MIRKSGIQFIPNPDSVPLELQEHQQWVCWRYEQRKGKETKVPYSPITGAEAASTNLADWSSFQNAVDHCRQHPELSGVGFIFAPDDEFVGIDIDDCIQDGVLTDTARSILRQFPGTYAEVSPSGYGLKLWVRGSLPLAGKKTGRKCTRRKVEVYRHGRYFTLTGQVLVDPASERHAGCSPEIVDHSAALSRWFTEFFPQAHSADKTDVTPAQPASTGIQEIVDRASAARNGQAFHALYAGDLSAHGDDHSSADQAFCNLLAFWCDRDPQLMDQVFRSSGLMRTKWERADYRNSTISKAIESCHEVFDWNNRQGVAQMPTAGAGSASTAEPEPWQKLIPLSGPKPPEIVPNDLPEPLREFVAAVVEETETPDSMAMLGLLGVLAVSCQRSWEIQTHGCHTEQLSLFIAVGLNPGERKSSVLKLLTAPLRTWEREQAKRMAPEIQQRQSVRKTQQSRAQHLRGKAAKENDIVERQVMEQELLELDLLLDEPMPSLPVLFTSDATSEALAALIEKQGERMAVISDEGGILQTMAGRYSRGVTNIDLYLQGFCGSPVRVHRVNREPTELEQPALSMLLCVQPQVIAEAGRNADFTGRGLVQRFIFCMPESRLGYRQHNGRPVPQHLRDRWQRIACALLKEYPDPLAEQSEPQEPLRLTLTAPAKRAWERCQDENEIDLRPSGDWHFCTGWASKFPGLVGRIAGILHCAVCADHGNRPDEIPVDGAIMAQAVALGHKIKAHALHTFKEIGMDDGQRMAVKITRWIIREQLQQFTGREAAIACNSGGKVTELEDALTLLTEHGWIRQGNKRQPEGGGRPSHPYDVNPEVLKADLHQPGVSSVLSDKSRGAADETPALRLNQDVGDWVPF